MPIIYVYALRLRHRRTIEFFLHAPLSHIPRILYVLSIGLRALAIHAYDMSRVLKRLRMCSVQCIVGGITISSNLWSDGLQNKRFIQTRQHVNSVGLGCEQIALVETEHRSCMGLNY